MRASSFEAGQDATRSRWRLRARNQGQPWTSVQSGALLLSKFMSPSGCYRSGAVIAPSRNQLHWVLDVHLNEDGNRARPDNAPENLARLRRLALNSFDLAPVPLPYVERPSARAGRRLPPHPVRPYAIALRQGGRSLAAKVGRISHAQADQMRRKAIVMSRGALGECRVHCIPFPAREDCKKKPGARSSSGQWREERPIGHCRHLLGAPSSLTAREPQVYGGPSASSREECGRGR